MNFQSFQMEQTNLTLTQLALGAELLWEPKVGTPQHDRCVDAYIPGAMTLQQKRATICIDFFNTVEATTMPYPFTRTYHISLPVVASPVSTPKPTGTKRAHDGATTASKRLPGFSIMTRDGVDVTENQSRGPKTKEQREHAAKMRKLGACPSCKRRKQKCEPSHHRPSDAPLSLAATPMSSSMSARSSIPSLPSLSAAPSTGSRASISPQSSLESAFTPSPLHASMMPMPAGISKQPQPWEDGLLSFDSLDDEFMLNTGAFDDFAFGQDTSSQNVPAGNWDFTAPVPVMGQDFDLFSYDNTLDFDANLYGNTPSPLLQSSNLSPASLQQPPQAFAQSFSQSMDASPQPFAYDAIGQYLGNVDGTASEYGVAVDSRYSGELDGLEPDRRPAVAREPVQEVAQALGQSLQSRILAGKQQRSIPQSGVNHNVDHETIDPRTDLLLESIASSPESSVLSSMANSPHVDVQTRGPTWGSDVSSSQSSSLGVGLQDVQDTASGLLTPPGSQRTSMSKASSPSALEHSAGVSFQHHSGRLENADRTVLSPGSGQPSLPPTSSVASFLDSFEDSSMSSTAHSLTVVVKDNVVVKNVPNNVDREMLTEHTAAKTNSLSTIAYRSTDTPKNAGVASASGAVATMATVHRLAENHGLVPSVATTVNVDVDLPASAVQASATTTSGHQRTQPSAIQRDDRLSTEVAFPMKSASPSSSAPSVGRTSVLVKDNVAVTSVANNVDRETLTQHTAAKTHSLSVGTYRSTDTPKVKGVSSTSGVVATLATIKNLAESHGLVPSLATAVNVNVDRPTSDGANGSSLLATVTKTVSSLLMQFSHGFRVGHSHAVTQAKSIGRGPGKDLEVLMGGLRLC